jgi:uncharacterized Ntn-hydrolase superfamily protein
MKKIILLTNLFFLSYSAFRSQDTFSMLAFDSITGEVGAAGASCVDLFNFPAYSNHFIAELFPGVGAIATQASYLATNQLNARNHMNAGESPLQILNWLQNNDAGSNPSVRQYGIVRMMPDSVQAAAFTGSNCMTYKNHIVGPNYTIQGNILLGQKVLDSMEARFKREKGDLACKLMAALQGAKMVGADSRCAPNNSSSLFAFVKVTQPTDTFGSPSFLVSLKTHSLAMIEPIDSLQKLFTAVKTCTNDWVSLKENSQPENNWSIFPNPARDEIKLGFYGKPCKVVKLSIYSSLGLLIREETISEPKPNTILQLKGLEAGTYYLQLSGSGTIQSTKKLIICNE